MIFAGVSAFVNRKIEVASFQIHYTHDWVCECGPRRSPSLGLCRFAREAD